MAQPATDRRVAELAELRAANARLVRALERERRPTGSGASGRAGARMTRTRRWGRAALSAVLITLGAILASVAVVSAWAHDQLTDTDAFVATFAPLAQNPAVQDLVAAEAAAAIGAHIDVDRIVDDLFAGLGGLDLDARAREALDLLRAPVVAGVEDAMQTLIHDVVASDAFAALWKDTLEITHRQLVNTVTGRQDAVITAGQNQQIRLELGPIVDAVARQLVADGFPLADRLPVTERSIVIAEDTSIGLYLAISRIVSATGIWLPWILLILLFAGVLVSPKRALARAWASGAVLFTMVLTGTGIDVGRGVFARAVAGTVPHDAALVLYDTVLGFVTSMLLALGAVAAGVLVVTLFAGPWTWARSVRARVLGVIADLRRGAEQRGITTGSFGERLARWRPPLRFGIAAACAAYLLLVRPVTVGTVLWLIVIGVGAVIAVELLSRPVARSAAEPKETHT